MTEPSGEGITELAEKAVNPIRRILWAVLVSYVAMVAIAGFCIWYTDHVNQQSNHKWCELLITLDNPIPPDSANPRSVDAAIKFHRLRVNLGC